MDVVGDGQAEELAARAQARLARDEATHPVLRRVLVGADHARPSVGVLAERGGERAGVAGAQAPQRDPVAREVLRARASDGTGREANERWYVRALCAASSSLLAVPSLAGCGGGDAPGRRRARGEFQVEVVARVVPARQHIAENVQLRLRVRNADRRRRCATSR